MGRKKKTEKYNKMEDEKGLLINNRTPFSPSLSPSSLSSPLFRTSSQALAHPYFAEYHDPEDEVGYCISNCVEKFRKSGVGRWGITQVGGWQ